MMRSQRYVSCAGVVRGVAARLPRHPQWM